MTLLQLQIICLFLFAEVSQFSRSAILLRRLPVVVVELVLFPAALPLLLSVEVEVLHALDRSSVGKEEEQYLSSL